MKGSKLILCLMLMFVSMQSFAAKKYTWKGLDHEIRVELASQNSNSTQIVKAYGISGNVDKAMEQAIQDAVVAAIFYGYKKPLTLESVPALCTNEAASPEEFYEKNKAYFDDFFTTGKFLDYAENVNSGYPSGENNLPIKGGRQVRLNIKVNHDALRTLLEKEGIKRAL